MSLRVQVILEEKEARKFRSRAWKESKSLSAWLRDAGRKMIEHRERAALSDPESLKRFFKRCQEMEKVREPEWQDHKKTILLESQRVGRP